MIRKVVHLVRNAERSESLAAVIEPPSDLVVDTVDPAHMWSVLTNNGIIPECDDETDGGIGVFAGDYDPARHAHLSVVTLSDRVAVAPVPLDQSSTMSVANGMALSRKPQESVLRVVTLTARIEQYEVKRFVFEASTVEAIEALCGDDLWWNLPHIEAEIDERLAGDFELQLASYNAAEHSDLPFVLWHKPADFPSEHFLSGWHPTSSTSMIDTVESKRVGGLIGVAPNGCYHNARAVLRSLPEYADAIYVEGYVVTHDGAIFEHGWLVKDGRIIDPTIVNEGTKYFPGLEFGELNQVRAFLQTEWGGKVQRRPFHEAFGKYGCDSRSFQEAFTKARAYLLSRFGSDAVIAAARIRPESGLPWPKD